MKAISILVPESAVMQVIADPRYLFISANQFLALTGSPPFFEFQPVGLKRKCN